MLTAHNRLLRNMRHLNLRKIEKYMYDYLSVEPLVNPYYPINNNSGQMCVYYSGFIRKFQRDIRQTICKSNIKF